jgi:hypothetical protein
VWNFDFAAGLIKVLVPNFPMATNALVVEDFSTSVVMKLGDPGIANWDGLQYTWAQLFMYDYSGALDAQLDASCLTRYLKFTDGVL